MKILQLSNFLLIFAQKKMKHLLIVLALFSSCVAYAQSIIENGVLEHARYCIQNKQADKAKSELEKLQLHIYSAPNSLKIDYYFLLGVSFHQKRNYYLAIDELINSITYLYSIKDIDCEAYLKIAYYLADSFYQIGDLEKSESIINTALVRCATTWEHSAFARKLYGILVEIGRKKNESGAIISQLQKEMDDIPDSVDNNLSINMKEETAYQYDSEARVKGMPIANYISIIDSITISYTSKGQYDLSIKILDEAETELNNNGLQDHPRTGFLYLTKGNLYFRIRNLKDAKRHFLKAKELFERVDATSSIIYAKCLNSLALIYQEEEKYFYSTNLLYASLGIFKPYISKSNDYLPGYLALYDNIARNYYLMGEKNQAIDTWDETIRLAEKEGIWDIAYSSANNYAYAMLEMGDYKKGTDVLQQFLGHNINFDLKDAGFQNLLVLSYLNSDDNTISILRDYTEFSKKYLTNVITSFSAKERDAIWSDRARGLEMMTNAVCMKFSTPELRGMAYNTALYTKSIATKLPKFITEYVRNNTSSEIHAIYDELLSNKKKFVKSDISSDSLLLLSDRIGLLERKILSSISDYRMLFDDKKINYNEIRNHLGPSDVAIEFIIIPEMKSVDSIMYYYGALIERNSYESPKFIRLCCKDSLDCLLENRSGLSDFDYVNELYDIKSDKLYSLVFKPIEPYINPGDSVFYSLVDMMHKLNLMTIPHEGKRMMDLYSLCNLSSTSNLLETRNKDTYDKALIVGGIDYNESIEDMAYYVNKTLPSTSVLAERSNTRGTWDVIPGSLKEATVVDSLLTANSVSSTLLTHGKANEESIKSLSGSSPDILHIATHGFFYSDANKSSSPLFSRVHSEIEKNLPMYHCGLLFAGANNAWIGKELPDKIDDGILNAEEISLLDLSKTKLAVLSACFTGAGYIDDVDGVYGLQRGFKLAGVKSIIMSLWTIPDKETQYLMSSFYLNLMNGMDKSQAFSNAVQEMRKLYPLPYYWASFIILDGLN